MYILSEKVDRFLKKIISVVLALSLVLSVCMISGLSLNASAATVSGQKFFINLSQNTSWKNLSSLNVRYAKADGSTIGSTGSGGVTVVKNTSDGLFHLTAPAGATKIGISSSSFPMPDTVVPSGYRRIILKATSVNGTRYTNPHVHYFEGDSAHSDSAWPGGKMKSLDSSGTYYYLDIDDSYKKVVFNNGSNTSQTADLTINTSYSDCVSYYTGSGWSNPYAKIINVSSIPNRDTEIYLLQDGTFKESKYLSNLTDQSTNSNLTFSTVYVVNESWNSRSAIYATYDYNDPYKTTVTLTKSTSNGVTAFQGKIPEGAQVKFHPSKSNTAVASLTTSYPTGSDYDRTGYSKNTATYKITPSYERWGKLSDINDVNYDSVVPNRFSQSNIIGVDATYFDYLSDNERTNGYLNNYDLGYDDNNWEKGHHTWFPFKEFNSYISSKARSNSAWKYPLYFGNFFKDGNQYGYSSEISGLTRYYDSDYRYAINNSNGLSVKSDGTINFNQSIQGLAYSRLDRDGDIQAANGVKMPYFDADKLSTETWSSKRVAKVFKSYFPFKASTNSSGVTTYEFESANARDNVYFTWDGDTPKYVNYGSGQTYGVYDAATTFGNDKNGHGIFPFNNSINTKKQTVSGTTYTRGGNDNLDFGFGVRLDIDFRVPQYGTLNGTPTGNPVSFDYSGDDDLWVFIGEDETGADAKLVLDLGGDHKQAEGSIDFKNMTATANDVYADYSKNITMPSVPSNEFWIAKDSSYVDFCLHVWQDTSVGAWNDGACWIEPYNKSTLASDNFYKFRKSQLGSNTACDFYRYKNTEDAGKLYYAESISNLLGKAWMGNGSAYTGSVPTNLGKVVKSFNGGKTLEPTKTYHMVVFYMERGLAESNFSVGFTMTPANNDLRVSKTLDTSGVISEIASDLKTNEKFNYTISDGSGSQTGKSYTLNGSPMTLDSAGNFTLKDQNLADFNSTFKTGSDMTVNESLANALSYDASWELYDDVGDVIESSNTEGNATKANFNLINKNNESDDAFLSLHYTNKLKTSTLDITKDVFEKDGKTSHDTDQQFTFKLTLDLDGSGTTYDYKAYPIEYTINGEKDVYSLHSNGEFNIRKGQTVKLVGLPVGASYKLEEMKTVGFKPYTASVNSSAATAFGGTKTGTVGTDNSVKVNNIVDETSTNIVINKTLDGSLYSGSKFNYVLSGLDTMVTQYDDPESHGLKLNTYKTSGTQTVTKPSSGEVKFDDKSVLAFAESGYYRFKITEKFAEDVSETEQKDYTMDNSTIFVEIQRDSEGNLSAPKFFKVPNTALEGVTKDADYAPFFNENTYLVPSGTTPKFENKTMHGSVKVTKKDQSDNNLSETVFGLIKVSDKDIIDDSALQDIITANKHIITSSTNTSGEATFSDLVIFKDGKGEFKNDGSSVSWSSTSDDYISGTSTYQTYCLFEYQPKKGYNPSYLKTYFTLPTDGKYDVTFGYVDGAITVPNSSGLGMNMIIIFGAGVACTGAALAVGCCLRDKSRRRKRKLRHIG